MSEENNDNAFLVIMVFDVPSISNQWPVRTHIHTMKNDIQKDKISAGVNLPQQPNDILKTHKKV